MLLPLALTKARGWNLSAYGPGRCDLCFLPSDPLILTYVINSDTDTYLGGKKWGNKWKDRFPPYNELFIDRQISGLIILSCMADWPGNTNTLRNRMFPRCGTDRTVFQMCCLGHMKDSSFHRSCSCQSKKKVRDLGPSDQSQPESPVSVVVSSNSTRGCEEWTYCLL